MSGILSLNFPLFHAEAARLRALGYLVTNPAEINGGADELVAVAAMGPEQYADHWRGCMKRDIPALLACDAVALLPGWERSTGACIEHLVALELGMPVIPAPDITFYVDLVPGACPGIARRLRHWALTNEGLSAACAALAPPDEIRTALLTNDHACKELMIAMMGGVQ